MFKKITPILLILLTTLSGAIFADNYTEDAKKIRNMVWNWDIDAFKNYSVPEQYTGESAVVLARHQQIEAVSKNKFNLGAILYGDMSRQLYYTQVDRTMILLKDQKALEEYSELSFRRESRLNGLWRSNKLKTIVGARLIKPDGTIQEIDVDADAVGVTEGKDDREAFKMLTIKGLQTGDILDYFYAEEMALETYNVPPLNFSFFSHHPTLSYSVECIFGDKLTVEYRSVNGAPDFTRSEDGDKNVILRTAANNLPVVDDLEDVRWVSFYRDFPMIRMVILNNTSKLVPKSSVARKSGVYKDLGYDVILGDKRSELVAWMGSMRWMGDIYKKVKKVVSNYRQKRPDATHDDLALYIYDALRFYWPNDAANYPQPKFYIALDKLLVENGISSRICFITSRFGPRKADVVESDDLFVFISANNNKQLFFYPNGYLYAGEIPSFYHGEEFSAIRSHELKLDQDASARLRKLNPHRESATRHQVPGSSPEENRSRIKTGVTLQEENPLELKIRREVTSSGEMKRDFQRMLGLYQEWDSLMRKRLLIETDLYQDLQNDKNGRKYIEQYKTIAEEKKKEQREMMEMELKDFHAVNSGSLIRYAVKKLGSTPEEPHFEMETEYTIDGLVKRAGDDLLFEAGKLIGTQWIPTEKERKRDFDAYIYAPLLIENEITIDIPALYRVEGVENLNQSIENEWGKFTATASVEGNLLKIVATKVYKRDFVSRKDWNTFLEMIDKTNEFYSQSVVLKYAGETDPEIVTPDVPVSTDR